MPHLMMQYQLVQRQEIQLIPMTQSIFIQVEEILKSDQNYSLAIRYLARGKRIGNYRSLIDFLFCQIEPKHRRRCFAFYRGVGNQLVNSLSSEELVRYNNQLICLLKLALKYCEKGEQISWQELVDLAISQTTHQSA